MSFAFILANAAAAEATKFEVIAQGIVGLFVVLFILTLLTLILSVLSLVFKEKPKPVRAAVAAPVASLDPRDPHTRVVLAAAAHVARDLTAHLPVIAAAVALEVAGNSASLQLAPPDTSWAGAGRQAIFASHVTRA
jgi:Na+-transporting methylmalonyl-CoA/oxaloacetate decarboxylase gamma subunit